MAMVEEMGRARRSEVLNLKPLLELSAAAVVQMLPSLKADHDHEPLSGLPRSLMGLLAEEERRRALPEREDLLYRQHCTSDALLGWNTHAAYIETNGWDTVRFQKLLHRITTKSQGSLKSLALRYCPVAGRPALIDHLSHLSGLTSFAVHGELADDTLLEAIAVNLTNLRDLSVQAHNVTDEGVARLALLAKRLEVIDLRWCTQVTWQGLAVALEHLPRLRLLRHPTLGEALVIHSARYGCEPSAPYLMGTVPLKQPCSAKDVAEVLRTAPLITGLDLSKGVPQDLTCEPLIQAEGLRKLLLRHPPTGLIGELAVQMGSRLRVLYLELSDGESLDFSLLCRHCPVLEELTFNGAATSRSSHPMRGTLRHLSVAVLQDTAGNVPRDALKAILTSPRLEEVAFSNTIYLDDTLLAEVCRESLDDRSILNRLRGWRLWGCRSVGAPGIAGLVHLAPRLRVLRFSSCPLLHEEALTSLVVLIQNLGLDEVVDLATDLGVQQQVEMMGLP